MDKGGNAINVRILRENLLTDLLCSNPQHAGRALHSRSNTKEISRPGIAPFTVIIAKECLPLRRIRVDNAFVARTER